MLTHPIRRRRLKALIVKEFLQIIRDPSSILISFVLPIVLLFLYGFGVSLDMDTIRIGLILEDTSPDAESFAESLFASPYFEVYVGRHRNELIEKMIRGEIRGLIVIPSYFSEFRKKKNHIAPIQVIADGSEPNTANFVQNYAQGAWQNWLEQERVSSNLQGLSLLKAEPRFWYNETLESRYFLVPGSLAIIMTLIGSLLTALVVAREWERGTMEALMATPITITELVVGKLIPYFLLGMGSMLACTVFGIILYQVPLRGSLLLLTLVSAVFLIPALATGLLISTLARNQFVAAQAGIVSSFLPAFILSGFIFEISSMPWPIRTLTYFLPARYFVSSLQTLFLVGNVWKLILINITCMLLLGSVILLITAKNTIKRLD